MNRGVIILCFLILVAVVMLLYYNRPRQLPSKVQLTSPEEEVFPRLFQRVCQEHPTQKALMTRRDGKWEAITYQRYQDYVQIFGVGLMMWGLKPGDRVGIIGFNAPGWVTAHLATMSAGGVSVGIYPTNSPEACSYLMDHAQIKVLVVENLKQLNKFLEEGPLHQRFNQLKVVISYSEEIPDEIKDTTETPMISWHHLFSMVQTQLDPERLERFHKRTQNLTTSDPATLIYTSGTTGQPKGTIITHGNIIAGLRAIFHRFQHQGIRPVGLQETRERIISYLPMNHIAAQMFDIYLAVAGANTVYFADPDVLKGSLGRTLQEVRPTIFIGVPRVWEKIQEKVEKQLKKLPGWQQWLYGLMGRYLPHLRTKLLLKKIGFDQCQFQVTSAAPLRPATRAFYQEIGFPLYDLYGMSETAGLGAIALPDTVREGSTGKPFLDLEVEIWNSEGEKVIGTEGEIMIRGPVVFGGYLDNPEATQEVLTEEGWLRTGDLGKLDTDGYLYITGRAKELIITAGGENIAPVPIEDRIKKHLPMVQEAVVIGDQKKFLSVLLTLKTHSDEEGQPTDQLTHSLQQKYGVTSLSEANDSELLSQALTEGIKQANQESISNAQRVQKWKILPAPLTIKGGELTPTLKLKRRVIVQKYEEVIQALYE